MCNFSFLLAFLLLTTTNYYGSSFLPQEGAAAAAAAHHQPQVHIFSLVKQNKSKAKYLELADSGEKIKTSLMKSEMVENLSEEFFKKPKVLQQTKKFENFKTDDMVETNKITLESTNDEYSRLRNETNSGFYLRFKQSIPVLEPVRHLLNTVREGFNHTAHFNKTRHQLIGAGEKIGGAGGGNTTNGTSNSAIETEAEREMVLHGSESTNFQLLDFFGSVGGMIWGFLMNIKKWFAASSGNASAAFSGGSF